MRQILLVEPGYKNKYPPLGLMKIATYHKLLGDEVRFVKGCESKFRAVRWDRIYVSTLFTFYWKKTMETIYYYQKSVANPANLIVGGVMATLLKEEIEKELIVTVLPGLLDKPGLLDSKNRIIIDHLVPDYGILAEIEYKYNLDDAYIGYATRGCPNRCSFCAVSKIEPEFCGYLPLKRQIHSIESLYGPKRHLILLDNNILASPFFDRIIDDILELGFYKGAKLNKGLRTVDFNQGVDLRLLNEEKMRRIAELPVKPLRIAFDHIELKEEYIEKIRLAAKYGILNLSNYILYNYTDDPEDFYERLRINVELNEELGTKIYSFPMKYIPLDAKNRNFIGEKWNRRLIRGVQCILLATRGKVGLRMPFFEAAFGRNSKEFLEIAMMPEHYIIHREKFKENQAKKWRQKFADLDDAQKKRFMEIASSSDHRQKDQRYNDLLEKYKEEDE